MSLTDDWKAGKLKNGWYFCLYENDAVFPALCFDDDFDDYALKVTEVLAPCDFDHFVELTEKVKKFEKAFAEALKCNDDLSAVITGCELEVNKLRELLKGCKEYLSDVDEYFTKNADEATVLLTKIEEVLK